MGASHADQTHGGGREQANHSKELHYDILPLHVDISHL